MDDAASNTERTAIRENFYAQIGAYNITPLWERVHQWPKLSCKASALEL